MWWHLLGNFTEACWGVLQMPCDCCVRLDTLYHSGEVDPPVLEEPLLKKLLLNCTRVVEFSFDNCMYRQIDCDGLTTWAYSCKHFSGLLRVPHPCWTWPNLCRRYVDDTFSLFNAGKEAALQFLHILNKLHPSIQFSMEGEVVGRLSFLDALGVYPMGEFRSNQPEDSADSIFGQSGDEDFFTSPFAWQNH